MIMKTCGIFLYDDIIQLILKACCCLPKYGESFCSKEICGTL